MVDILETLNYDPRYDRAKSVEDAKARYLDEDLDYDVIDLERDLERLIVDQNS